MLYTLIHCKGSFFFFTFNSMLILLSPAKSLNFDAPSPQKNSTEPEFLDDTARLVKVAKQLSVLALQELMDISPALAQLNKDRFAVWSREPKSTDTKQALFAFDGDVYSGLQAQTMNKAEVSYLQNHLRILSGLYGILKPLDLIQAYRLEMGCKLKHADAENLYDFWTQKVTNEVANHITLSKNKVLINLASVEYAKVVNFKRLPFTVITPKFLDYASGQYKIVSFFAKKARGSMVRYCAMNRVKDHRALKLFDSDGYCFNQEKSTETSWVFQRRLSK
jgi:cytoplasmic iron level regulating protein YaaA (DUF328/UPF0246 family)